MSDIIFVNGLSAKKPHENAPDFVKANLSVKVASLHEWLNENQGLANDAGFINLTLKESIDKGFKHLKMSMLDESKMREEYLGDNPIKEDYELLLKTLRIKSKAKGEKK